jgi:glyoxylase-like metal-dependent hydrolase (beta-lactamase superfamily II)
MGDLLFVEFHPYLADGDPEHLLVILKEIEGLNAKVFLPGHGPLGGREDLEQIARYVNECKRVVQEYAKNGGSEENISQIEIPEWCANWEFSDFFHINARFFFQKIMAHKQG